MAPVSVAPVGGALLALVLAGCGGLPAGVDGDLTGEWATMPAPELIVPEAGVCLDNEYAHNPGLGRYANVVDCAEPHQVETFHVGFFEGEAADRHSSPEPGTELWRTAYRECDTADDEYLGADFRHGDLWLGVGVPADAVWDAGSRWFRCDLVELQTYAESSSPPDSLRGLLGEEATARPGLVLGCFTVETGESDDGFTTIESKDLVPCTEPHQAEFVGVWENDRSRYPDSDRDWNDIHSECRELAAAYVDAPLDDPARPFRVGTIVDGMTQEDWDNGDRSFRCFLWLDEREVTRSLAGAGFDALPST